MPSHGARMDQLAGRLPLATPMRPERKAEELRHAVTFESTSLVAELLLVRRTRSLSLAVRVACTRPLRQSVGVSLTRDRRLSPPVADVTDDCSLRNSKPGAGALHGNPRSPLPPTCLVGPRPKLVAAAAGDDSGRAGCVASADGASAIQQCRCAPECLRRQQHLRAGGCPQPQAGCGCQ